jgi:hypothetical protein
MSDDLFGQSEPFSGRWPASGSMRNGQCWQQATPAPRTSASGSSSSPGLLPTPAAGNFNDGESLESWEARRQANLAKGINGNGQGTPLAVAAQALLKTPTAQLAVNGGSQHPDKRKAGGHGPTLADQVEHTLLPTPTAREKGGGNAPIGRTRDGRPRTNADADLPAAVALLPTPTSNVSGRTGEQHMAMRRAMGRRTPSQLEAAAQLLPTPQATDGNGGPREIPEARTHRGRDHGPRLRDMAPALLPTPSVADATGGHKTRSGDRKDEPLLGGIAMLLPTPSAMDSHGARNATAKRTDPESAHHDGWTLSDVFWTGDRTPPPSDGGKRC